MVVGADGTLGAFLVKGLGATGAVLRAPGTAEPEAPAAVRHARVVVNVAGPRVRPGLGWTDYVREHVGVSAALARAVGPGTHLVHLSSAAVFGGHRGAVISPDTPEQPLSFPSVSYACAKLAAEGVVRGLCAARGLGLTVVRPPVVYGPGIGSALESFRRLAARGVRLQLRPDGAAQHNLHGALLLAVVRRLIERGPLGPRPLVPCDPFVTTNADLNAAVGTRGVPLPVSLPLCTSVLARWPGWPDRSAPSALEAFAALGVDNTYDAHDAFARLGLEPSSFSRAATFDRWVSELG